MHCVKRVVVVTGIVIAASALAVGCAGTDKAGSGAGTAKGVGVAQDKCPVMGNPIDEAVFTEYAGKKVYFCCGGCIDEFKANPQKYLAGNMPDSRDERMDGYPTDHPETGHNHSM
jgi:YHS domain-containing protein